MKLPAVVTRLWLSTDDEATRCIVVVETFNSDASIRSRT